MNKNYTREQILQKELDIRKAVNYENEVSTHFEFVLLYIKIWKMGCQRLIKNKDEMFISTYKFMCEVESAAYDFTKSLIIDAEILKYKSSLVVAAIISVTLEIYFKLKIKERGNPQSWEMRADSSRDLPILPHLKKCNRVWDAIVRRAFGSVAIEHLDEFGRYLFLRQQRIFRVTCLGRDDKYCELPNIYKDRCRKFYLHSFYDCYLSNHLPNL